MAFEIIREVFEREHTALSPIERHVLAAVAYHADLVTRHAWPGNPLLAREIGVHRNTVSEAVSGLCSKGYFRRKTLPGGRRVIKVTNPDDWAAAVLIRGDEAIVQDETPIAHDDRAIVHDDRGIADDDRPIVHDEQNQSLTSQENQSVNQEGTTAAPKGRVNRPSLGEREISTKDLPTVLQQMTEAAVEQHEVDAVLEIDPLRLRSRLGQIMHHYRLTPADLVWMYDWFTRKTASRWATLNSHPLQWFTTNREIEDLVEVMRNKRAEATVDEDEGVNC